MDVIYGRVAAILPVSRWIEDLWLLDPTFIAVVGENLIHVKGFFPQLAAVACAYGDTSIFLLDAEIERRVIEFSLTDTDEQYGTKKRLAPEIGPGWGFPFGLCRQVFVGDGAWILLSDRDAERMCFISREMPSASQMNAVWRMFSYWM